MIGQVATWLDLAAQSPSHGQAARDRFASLGLAALVRGMAAIEEEQGTETSAGPDYDPPGH